MNFHVPSKTVRQGILLHNDPYIEIECIDRIEYLGCPVPQFHLSDANVMSELLAQEIHAYQEHSSRRY